MNTDQTPQQNNLPEGFTPEALHEINASQPFGGNNPTQIYRRHPRRKAIIVAGVVGIVLLTVASIVWLLNQGSTCLNDDDYKTLTGVDRTDPLSSQTSFWTDIIYFMPKSVSYDNSSTVAAKSFASVGTFARTHANKSLVVAISGDYYSDSQLTLTQQRISAVRAGLIAAGVSANSIQLIEPNHISVDDDETNGNDINSPIAITITSATTCK